MIRRPPRSTQSRSSAASDVYKRQALYLAGFGVVVGVPIGIALAHFIAGFVTSSVLGLSLIHISEPTRLLSISYAVFCLPKNKSTTYAPRDGCGILTVSLRAARFTSLLSTASNFVASLAATS